MVAIFKLLVNNNRPNLQPDVTPQGLSQVYIQCLNALFFETLSVFLQRHQNGSLEDIFECF